MRINNTKEEPIKIDNEAIKGVTAFTYLASVMAVDGGAE